MKNLIEKVFYYLMSVCFMNIIFAIRMIPEYIINLDYNMNLVSWIMFGFVSLLAILGIFTSIIIAIRTTKFHEKSLGVEFKIVDFKNHTGEQYFTHFSLLVLTAFAIPYTNIIFDVSFILLVHLLLCFIYVREKLFYINPTLNILKYRIYECVCENIKNKEKKNIYVFAKNINVSTGMILKVKSSKKDIFRINNKSYKGN